MKNSLRILHVEDSEDDWELVGRLLRKEWPFLENDRIQTRTELEGALRDRDYDLILSDFKLPDMDGLDALKVSRVSKAEVPFIFVSGMMGEEVAIESLRNGATDYVLKGHLKRLVPAIHRALNEAEERRINQELNRKLQEAERLRTVETLSSGISHDFNNILTIILGQAALLHVGQNQPHRVVRIAETISQAAHRATGIVRQLMAFAQQSEGNVDIIDFNAEVEGILRRLQRGMPGLIELHFDPGHSITGLVFDAMQLESILSVLLSNCQDSMPGGGSINVSSRLLTAKDCLRAPEPKAEAYIRLEVSDTGTGMDAATREHIFEPFYTTKERGRGTGLGLPAVYGIMQAHKGWIDVDSVVGQGTTVTLYFPVVRPHPVGKGPQPFIPGDRDARSGTLLVIEDEEDILFFVEAILTREGYRILTAKNHDQAFALFDSHRNEVCLAFSDIGLPVVDGLTICEKLKEQKPELKIILTSGYSQKDFKERIESLGVDAFLLKPYTPQKLCQEIRSTLYA